MSESLWDAAMAQLAAAQRDFMNGDATGLRQLYSHRDDVTVMGGFGGFERGWTEVRPAACLGGIALSRRRLSAAGISALLSARTSPAWYASNTGREAVRLSWTCASLRRSGWKAIAGGSSIATPMSSCRNTSRSEPCRVPSGSIGLLCARERARRIGKVFPDAFQSPSARCPRD